MRLLLFKAIVDESWIGHFSYGVWAILEPNLLTFLADILTDLTDRWFGIDFVANVFPRYPFSIQNNNLTLLLCSHENVDSCVTGGSRSYWWRGGSRGRATSGFRGRVPGRKYGGKAAEIEQFFILLTINFACSFAHERCEYEESQSAYYTYRRG